MSKCQASTECPRRKLIESQGVLNIIILVIPYLLYYTNNTDKTSGLQGDMPSSRRIWRYAVKVKYPRRRAGKAHALHDKFPGRAPAGVGAGASAWGSGSLRMP